MNLSKIMLGIGAMSAFAAVKAQNSDETQKRMNVLFIAVDDMKPFLGAYGDTTAVTPGIDRLAARGTTFNNAYCQVALSGPSRSSLLTGLNPDHTGVWWLMGSFRKNNPEIVPMPECFKNQGYETVGVGKIYHPLIDRTLRDDPKSWSKPYIKTGAPAYRLANGRVATECADVPDNGYVDGIITDEAIKELVRLEKSDKPWFLAVGFKKPHLPFCAPKKYWDLYERDKMPVAEFQDTAVNAVPYAYHNSLELKGYSDIPPFESYIDTKHLDLDTQRRLLHAYYACISYVDAQIERLIEALDESGMADNTIIVLFGDHGYHLGDHGLWNKITDFEQSTNAPLIIAVPGMTKGKVSHSVVSFTDIFPTLADLTGIKVPEHLDGVSLKPVLKNPKAKAMGYAISQVSRTCAEDYKISFDSDLAGKAEELKDDIMGYSIRTDRYRLVEWTKGFKTYDRAFDTDVEILGYELYDYTVDPEERVNLAGDPSYSKIEANLKNKLHKYYKESYESPYSAPIKATADGEI